MVMSTFRESNLRNREVDYPNRRTVRYSVDIQASVQ